MDEERLDQLYNRILDGENWNYSTLDELISLSESNARKKGYNNIRNYCIYINKMMMSLCRIPAVPIGKNNKKNSQRTPFR